MKPDPIEQELRELAWRRPLTAAEQTRLEDWLARHPEARADWSADTVLSAALARLPKPSVPSNLTARVLAAIDREEIALPTGEKAGWIRWLGSLGWAPRLTLAVLILAGGAFWYQQQRATRQVEALAALATVTEVSGMPSAEALENFEVILKIHPAPLADTELLSMTKQLAEFKP